MRQLTFVLVFALMATVLFAGCNAKHKEEDSSHTATESTNPADVNACGGWRLYTEAETPEIPKDIQAVFDKAMEEFTGAEYSIVAYLGSQIVSGTNYEFLCNSTRTTAKPVTTLKLVTIYEDLEGKVEISEIADINVTEYTEEKDMKFEQLSGAFQADKAIGGRLSEEVQIAYDKAMENLMGVSYEPIALLASQIVSGNNYAILCKATSVTEKPCTKLAVVTIYADLKSNAEITSTCPFEY